MRHAPARCVSCDRPVPGKAVACPYCGEDVARHPAWLLARRAAPWLFATAVLGLLAAHGRAIPGDLREAWAATCMTPAGKLLAALSLGFALAPGASSAIPGSSLARPMAGLGSIAAAIPCFHLPAAGWVAAALVPPAAAGLLATRDIEPWRFAPLLLLPLAWTVAG